MSQKIYRYVRLPKRASLGLRIVASAAMLAVLLTRFPATDLQRWPNWRSESWLWMVASLAATLTAFCLASIRWLEVCRTLGKPQKFLDVLNYFVAGQFVGNFLPTTVGGDILRVSRMGAQIRDHSSAFASVVIERLTGWLVLPLITLLAFVFNPGLVSTKGGKAALGLAIGTLVLLSLTIYLAEHPRFGGRLSGDSSVTRALAAVHRGLKIYRQAPGTMLRLLAVAVAFQGRCRASVAPRQPTTLAEATGSGAAAGRPGSQGDADGGDITAVPAFSAFERPTPQRWQLLAVQLLAAPRLLRQVVRPCGPLARSNYPAYPRL